MTDEEDTVIAALFDQADAKIKEQRERICQLEQENADLRAALLEAQGAP